MTKQKKFWRPGEMANLARAAAITLPNLSATLHRRRRVSLDRAFQLECASAQVLKRPIPWSDWLNCQRTKHPAFFGRPLPRPKSSNNRKTEDRGHAA